jgi:hypothetical protein
MYFKLKNILRNSYFHLFLYLIISYNTLAQGEPRKIQVNFFGHLEYDLDKLPTTTNSFLSLGEQDFFINSKITDKFSFLGETVIRPDLKSATLFSPSIERMQIKYDYYKNHSLIVGKMHTPLNHWNDVYHHGRLFFPTVDRPLAFSYLIPLHTTGLRLQGQNLGDYKFGYDIVSGNGISSTDFSNLGFNKSFLASFQIKPIEYAKFQLSYYYDFIENNQSGIHSGHSSAAHQFQNSQYKGNINFQLVSFSAAYFSNKFELLNETVLNTTKSDTLGTASNMSIYLYAGYRIKGKYVPYICFDHINVAENDLHVGPLQINKLLIGLRYEISHQLNLKLHFAANSTAHSLAHAVGHGINDNSYEFKIQLSYGL